MSQLIIAGDTSGTITLQAPAVAGSTTLTLPATTGNFVTTTGTPSTAGNVLTSDGANWISAAPSGLGIGQTWTAFTNVTRVFGTTYTNSTGKPISVFASATGTAPSNSIGMTFYVNQGAGDVIIYTDSELSNNNPFLTVCTGIVPNGATYRIVSSGNGGGTPTWNSWAELR